MPAKPAGPVRGIPVVVDERYLPVVGRQKSLDHLEIHRRPVDGRRRWHCSEPRTGPYALLPLSVARTTVYVLVSVSIIRVDATGDAE